MNALKFSFLVIFGILGCSLAMPKPLSWNDVEQKVNEWKQKVNEWKQRAVPVAKGVCDYVNNIPNQNNRNFQGYPYQFPQAYYPPGYPSYSPPHHNPSHNIPWNFNPSFNQPGVPSYYPTNNGRDQPTNGKPNQEGSPNSPPVPSNDPQMPPNGIPMPPNRGPPMYIPPTSDGDLFNKPSITTIEQDDMNSIDEPNLHINSVFNTRNGW